MKLRQKQEHAELIDLDMKSKTHIEQMSANFERERQVQSNNWALEHLASS
jgi:hypothetical protein